MLYQIKIILILTNIVSKNLGNLFDEVELVKLCGRKDWFE